MTSQQAIDGDWAFMGSFSTALGDLQNAAQSGDVAAGGGAVVACLESVGYILGGGGGNLDLGVAEQLADWQSVADSGQATVSGGDDLTYLLESAQALYAGWYAYLEGQAQSPQPRPIAASPQASMQAFGFLEACRSQLASLM